MGRLKFRGSRKGPAITGRNWVGSFIARYILVVGTKGPVVFHLKQETLLTYFLDLSSGKNTR